MTAHRRAIKCGLLKQERQAGFRRLMQREDPKVAGRSRFRWVVAALFVGAVCIVLFFRRDTQPRYLDKTARQWFPLFSLPGRPAGQVPIELTTGNPESLNVLIAAMRISDPWWMPYETRLPLKVREKLQLVPAFQVHWLAASAIKVCALDPRFATALANRLEELPLNAQLQLDSIPDGPSKAILDSRLLPIFEGHLRTKGLPSRLRVTVALQLLRFEGLSDDTLRSLVQLGVEVLKSSAVSTLGGNDAVTLLGSLGRVGPISESLTLPLRSVLPDLAPGHCFELRLALTRLNPGLFPTATLFASATNSLDAFSQFEAVHFLLKNASRDAMLPENLGPILEQCLLFHGTPDREEVVVRDKVSMLMEYAFRSAPAVVPTWRDSFAVGLDDPSRQVRRASAWTLYQMKANSAEVVEHVAHLLEQGREPELALMILTEARVVPERVASLVRSLAAGEPVKDWTPEPAPDREVTAPAQTATRAKSLQQFAQALLASVSRSTPHRR